jgi:hypothetical protein
MATFLSVEGRDVVTIVRAQMLVQPHLSTLCRNPFRSHNLRIQTMLCSSYASGGQMS